MAMDKNGKKLPKGITLRADGRYMGRFVYENEKYVLYDRDLKALKKQLADLKYEVEHGLYAREENITVISWFETWMSEYKANSVKAGTMQTYKQVFNTHIKPIFRKKLLKDIRPEMIQKLINDLYNKGYSKARVNIPYIIFLGMYKQAVKNGIVRNNPAEHITFPKFQSKKEKRVLSLEEQRLFLEYAADSKYYDFYLIALSTGMRCGEILALEWADINFKEKMLHVSGTLVYPRRGNGRYKDTPKTNCSYREIPIIGNVESMFKARRKKQIETRLMMGELWQPDKGLENTVFTYETGVTFWDTAIRVDMKKIVERIRAAGIGFDDITPHTFRHTFATRGLEQGIPPKVMQTILGHSTLAMTMDLYSHVLPDTKASEMQKIANLF